MMNSVLYFLEGTTMESAEKRTQVSASSDATIKRSLDIVTKDKPKLLGSKSQCQVNEPK